MKKESPLWSSISLLIGIVIAILALIRGRMLLPLLLAVFALWLLWWLLTQALPLWRNNRAYKRYNADVFTGVNCRTAAVFQFHSAALRRLNKVGCQRYEGDYTRLKQKHAERRARRMAG